MTRIEDSIRLALEVHSGQVDRGGTPYIYHPLMVMALLASTVLDPNGDREYQEDLLCTAILHDCIEDAEPNSYIQQPDKACAREAVQHRVQYAAGQRVFTAVEALTRRRGASWTLDDELIDESYDDYLTRVERDVIARPVKICDLEHNMQLNRIPSPTERDYKRVARYVDALARLKQFQD